MTDGHRPVAPRPPLPWRRSVAWLLVLGPLFFASYGFANWAALQRDHVPSLAFAWERSIPFLPWTIVPYWSIDLIYGLSFLACRSAREVDRHGLRLLTVQVVAIACFLLVPMRFSFDRPATDGALGTLFAALEGFDQPFNQAPSLHVAILVVLWVRVVPALRGAARAVAHAWFVLIGVSVLTTFQHHFIDIPTGALLGFLALWAWPDEGRSPLAGFAFTPDRARRAFAWRYAAGALACAAAAFAAGGVLLWLLWPAVALLLVACAYAAIGPDAFQKRGARPSVAAAWLFAPYTLGAWINSRLWTHRHPAPDAVTDGVWIGRMPTAADRARRKFEAVVDLCAELPAPALPGHVALPWLDLVPPAEAELRAAAAAIEQARGRGGDVLVCCALGYGRSACAVAGWLIATGRAQGAEDALSIVRARRPGVAAGPGHGAALAALAVR